MKELIINNINHLSLINNIPTKPEELTQFFLIRKVNKITKDLLK